MKVAVISAIIQIFSIAISIGETLGQGFQAWQEGGPEVGQAVHSASRAVLQHTSHFQQQLDDAVRTTFHETSADDVNRSGDNKGRHSTVGRRQDDCKNSDIAECVGLLEVLTNNDLGFAASVDELNRMCPVLLNGLQCIDNYTRRCLTPKHREYFNKLYAGTIRVIKDLCNTKGKYQQEYIRHAPCMRQVNPKYNQCSEAYHKKTANLNQINDAVVQLTEEEKNRNVITLCCSFQEYLQCSERVVYETCGNETALFTKAFLDRMAGPIVQFKCVKYAPGSQVCENAGSSAIIHTSLLSLVAILFSIRHLLA